MTAPRLVLAWDDQDECPAPQGGTYTLQSERPRGEPVHYGLLWYFAADAGPLKIRCDFYGWPTKARILSVARRHAAAMLAGGPWPPPETKEVSRG